MAVTFEPTLAGAVCAAGAVAAGAPLFGTGLRALRLGRALARLEERQLADYPSGFASVRGRVALEGPLFGPLCGAPCAGFELVVLHASRGVVAVIDERRPFRLVADGVTARVEPDRRRWRVAETARRTLEPSDVPTQHLDALLSRAPEALRLRRHGESLTLIERALRQGAECHVVGQVRHGRPLDVAVPESEALLRTGTDDADVFVTAGASAPAAPDLPELWIDDGGTLDFLLVSEAPPGRPRLAWAGVQGLGLAAGPLLSLGGLLYLAHAADRLRELGRF